MTIHLTQAAAYLLVGIGALSLVLAASLIAAAIIALRDRPMSRSQRRRLDHAKFRLRLRELQQ